MGHHVAGTAEAYAGGIEQFDAVPETYAATMGGPTWTTFSRLLDDALDLPPAARAGWLNGLGPEHDAIKPRLSELLAQAGAEGRELFLATLPKFEVAAADGDASPSDEVEPLPDEGASRAGAGVGPYTLVRPIACGGQGMVWLAERSDGVLARPVALKLPHSRAFRPGLAERMSRERDILAALSHPHIARLYDAGVTRGGEPYLALEYVDGTAIDRHCQDRALSAPDRVRLFLQVVRAVAYAHGQLVIHRDLKPSNILVTAEGYVRLLDFGIAKLLASDAPVDSTLTADAGRPLTLPYASPEQVLHRPLGVATDIYSLGVVLYELLTGVRPHRPARESAAALEDAILRGDIARPSEAATTAAARKALAGDFDTIVLKALRTDPSERYATAEAFADDLVRALDGRPVLAQPDSRTYRVRKFVRRNQTGVALTGAALLAVLAGAGVAAWQAQVARMERDVAIAQRTRSEAVAGFLDWTLQQASTDRPLTAIELLERGVAQLDHAQDVDGAIRAFLTYEISKHYLRMNQTDRELALLDLSADGARRAGDQDIVAAAECSAAAAVVGRDLTTALTRLTAGERALAAVPFPSANARGDCLRARAQVLAFQGQVDEAIQWFERELPRLPSPRDNVWMRHGVLEIVLTGLYRRAGRFQDAQRVVEATVETLRRRGQHATVNEFAILGTVAVNLHDMGEVRAALVVYRDLVQWFERGAFASAPMVTLANAGAAELRAGQTATARRLAERAREASLGAGHRRNVAMSDLVLAGAFIAEGHLEDARRRLDAAEGFFDANPQGNRPQMLSVRLLRARLAATAGRLADARAQVAGVLAAVGDSAGATGPGPAEALKWSARLALDDRDFVMATEHASLALERSTRVARDQRQSADVGEAALIRARALAALGRTDEARRDAATAETALTAGLGPDHALTTVARALLATLRS